MIAFDSSSVQFDKCILNTYYVPAAVLGTGADLLKKTDGSVLIAMELSQAKEGGNWSPLH